MKMRVCTVVILHLLLLVGMRAHAWTLTVAIEFNSNHANAAAAASSPVTEIAVINQLFVGVSIFEQAVFRDDDGQTCTQRDANGTLFCGAFAQDATLTASFYEAEGVASALPNATPPTRIASATKTFVSPPQASIQVEAIGGGYCNWLVTSLGNNPQYTFVIQQKPAIGGSWTQTYIGLDTCIPRSGAKSYRAYYLDSGNNRGPYSSVKTTNCNTIPQ